VIVGASSTFNRFASFVAPTSRRQWIARIKRHVCNAAALRSIFRAPSARGKDIAFDKAVLMRIGIDQAANRAVLRRNLGLDYRARNENTWR